MHYSYLRKKNIIYRVAISLSILLILFSFSAKGNISDDIKLIINEETVLSDVSPIIKDNRTLVPMRVISEYLGANVNWNNDTRTVTVEWDESNVLKLVIDSKNAIFNNIVLPLDIAPIIYKERTMVPLRFIGEIMEAEVNWNEKTRTVTVNKEIKNPSIDPGPDSENKYNISDVVYRVLDDGTERITIKYDSLPEYKVFTLDNPYRVVIDFADTNMLKTSTQSISDSNLKSIRTAQFEEDTARLVLEFYEKSEYKVTKYPEGNAILVDLPASEAPFSDNIISEITTTDNANYSSIKIKTDDYLKYDVVTKTSTKLILKFNNVNYKENSLSISPSTTVLKTVITGNENDDLNVASTIKNVSKIYVKQTKTCTEIMFYKKSNSYDGIKIIIDPGHGGKQPGTVRDDVLEKDITLAVSLKLRDILINKGFDIGMIRDDDTYVLYTDRTSMAKDMNGDIFVSLHVNSYESSSPNGVEVHYTELNNGLSKKLSTCILDAVVENTDLTRRATISGSNLAVTKGIMPSCLVEMGFITNDKDFAYMTSDGFDEIMAKAIAKGILNYIDTMEIK